MSMVTDYNGKDMEECNIVVSFFWNKNANFKYEFLVLIRF